MYPNQQGQGYPPQQPYPQTGYPPQSGYPAPQPGFGGPGFNPSNPGYPMSNPGYPMSNPGYPPSNPGYPTQQPGYPTSSPYPTNTAQGYPTAQYPSAQTYPTESHQSAGPGYLQSSYPQSNYPQMNQSQGYPNSYGTSTQNEVAPPRSRPTVVPVSPFNPRQDAEALRKAMKGWGTNEKAIIDILTKRTNAQRQEIALEFKALYGKDLVSDLKGETSGNFRDILVALMTPLPTFYARELHDAVAGLGTNEGVLIEILCTLPNSMIKSIQQAYNATYGTLLEDDLRGDTSGHFKRILTSLSMGNRCEDFRVDPEQAKQDAKNLLAAGEQRLGTDESVFNAVFATRSFAQLAAVFREYQALTNRDIDEAIKSEFSGDIEKALRAIVRVTRSRPHYFAERLQQSMKGMGTNDRKLIRIMVTRCEIDLGDISEAFRQHYGQTLQEWIADDCSGDYKKTLLALLNDQ